MNRRNALRLIATAASLPPLASIGQLSKTTPNPNNTISPTQLTRKIPASGEMLPVIGLGTWQSFDVAADAVARAPLEAVLREFIALGGKLIDSSPMYGKSEEVAGDLMATLNSRDKIFLATKVWTSGKAAGIVQMEDSLKKLRTQKIELMQVHNLHTCKHSPNGSVKAGFVTSALPTTHRARMTPWRKSSTHSRAARLIFCRLIIRWVNVKRSSVYYL
jgi:hypothetical protein